jgi:hypothetical protein
MYAFFEDIFNIQLVIAFCGTGTQLFQQETGPFRFATDPALAERLTVAPGTSGGADFANIIVSNYSVKTKRPSTLPPVEKLPIARLSRNVWTNARLTAEFLKALLVMDKVTLDGSLAHQCHISLATAYSRFLALSGIHAYSNNMKRTLINGTYSLIREKLLGSAAPHLTIPACLDDGLFVIYQSHRTDPETTCLLRPATELTAGETRLR